MSQYATCTELCTRLQLIDPKDGGLPSRDELVDQLLWTLEDQEKGRRLGRWDELLGRTHCNLCQLAVAAISDSVPPGQNEIDPGNPIDVLLFPEEQSFRLSYPSRLGTHLAFVADREDQASAPDNARLVSGSQIPASQIVGWLRCCEENHAACWIPPPEPPKTVKIGDLELRYRSFEESATSNFRVIDVERGCVTRAALGIRYVALSYVWGQVPTFRLLQSNLERLSTEDSLEAVRPSLPKTINDAIDLVKAMGERYLWVDTLCLVQDDHDDVSLGIELMNSIYQGSYFTIVAGSGPNADSGLPGVASGSRRSTQVIRNLRPGLKMAVRHSIDWHLSRSVYNERGWTLQELVLPRRAVIFMNDQVYFRCQEANWSEESWADKWTHYLDPDDSNISRVPKPSEGILPSLWAYQKLCEEYSRRKLRNDGDALRAIAGISRPLATGMRTIMVEGLPGYQIDLFLLFVSSNGDLRRRREFASFSWAGWEGRIMWPRENFNWYDTERQTWDTSNILKWFKHKRLVEWGALDPRANLSDLTSRAWGEPTLLGQLMRERPGVFPADAVDSNEREEPSFVFNSHTIGGDIHYWDDADSGDSDRATAKRSQFSLQGLNLANSEAEYIRLVQRLGNTAEGRALQNWRASRFSRLRKAQASGTAPKSIAHDWELAHYRFRESRAVVSDAHEQESQVDDKRAVHARQWAKDHAEEAGAESFEIPNFPPYTVLHFRTLSIHLRLGTAADCRHLQAGQAGDSSAPSPFDRIPGVPLFSSDSQLAGSLHPDNLDLLAEPGSIVECLILSRSQTPTLGSALLHLRPTVVGGGADKAAPWDLFWVLHVVWHGGIAQRRGVGQVLASALETSIKPGPELKLVLLG